MAVLHPWPIPMQMVMEELAWFLDTVPTPVHLDRLHAVCADEGRPQLGEYFPVSCTRGKTAFVLLHSPLPVYCFFHTSRQQNVE